MERCCKHASRIEREYHDGRATSSHVLTEVLSYGDGRGVSRLRCRHLRWELPPCYLAPSRANVGGIRKSIKIDS